MHVSRFKGGIGGSGAMNLKLGNQSMSPSPTPPALNLKKIIDNGQITNKKYQFAAKKEVSPVADEHDEKEVSKPLITIIKRKKKMSVSPSPSPEAAAAKPIIS